MLNTSTSNLVLAIVLSVISLINVTAQNQPKQTVHGYVHAQGFPGRILKSTEVVVTNVWTQEKKTAYTDSKGHYELLLNTNDTYTIAANKNQYASMVSVIDLREHATKTNVEHDIPIELPTSAMRLPQNNCVLQGKVRLKTESKPTIPHVKVFLLDTETDKGQEIKTDESGFFQFNIEKESNFTIYAVHNRAFSDVEQIAIEGCRHPQKMDLYLRTAESTSNKQLTRLVNNLLPSSSTTVKKHNPNNHK